MKKDIKIFYVREGLFQSIIADIFSLGLVIAIIILNKAYLGDKWYFDIFALFLFFLKVAAQGRTKTFTDVQEFKDYVSKL